MARVEELTKHFPGIDCGACGAPSCSALAEDIIKGEAKETDCIYVLWDYVKRISGVVSEIGGAASPAGKKDGPEKDR